jgi:hypothetical protein
MIFLGSELVSTPILTIASKKLLNFALLNISVSICSAGDFVRKFSTKIFKTISNGLKKALILDMLEVSCLWGNLNNQLILWFLPC